MDIIEQVKERLSVFINLYDILRIIDPIKKKTIIIKDDHVEELEGTCYGFWEREEFCENCISMMAYIENDTFVKIENNEEKVFLVIATPLILENNKYIVEILKDISQNGKIIAKTNNNENFMEYFLNEMNEKIIKDELTGIYNRRYINERLPVDINNSIVKQCPLSVIMADIDFFKDVNDNYGHLIGDKVLMDFAKLVQSSIRKNSDWVGRYGGEEFLIVLNNTDLENAYKISEKIRKLLEDTIFEYDNVKVKITSSFGVDGLTNNKVNIQELISNADKNLYKAKTNGRNKTIVSEVI
ncbi:GGDEF domain-containing protein [Clostridium bowmanii]|uniref:GGDEF domain-containing protein n=1 Tax=Clostridium bowmanii TaxID=132925 RepID=UPI001C0C1378|nr:GGDEF domain-containing protein [Clostridium bowmanii]MBU3191882.1 GGDEF domain-containing protein [Clostridium bowmanii]MCA1076126.1 GGDEF domain-containing protein [Clostridium bowmanii]